MNNKQFPFHGIDIQKVEFKLFKNFNEAGNPELQEGKVTGKRLLKQLSEIISQATEYPVKIAPVSIGELKLGTNRSEYLLQLVFDLKKKKYLDMFYFNGKLLQINEAFSEFIEQQKK